MPSIFDNKVDMLLFAGNVKLFSINFSLSDALNLQTNLNKLLINSCQNGLPLNVNKFNVITFLRKKFYKL